MPWLEAERAARLTVAARRDLTLRTSDDGGRSWHDGRLVQEGPAGYCDLVALGERHIGVLYERGVEGEVVFRAVEVPDPPV